MSPLWVLRSGFRNTVNEYKDEAVAQVCTVIGIHCDPIGRKKIVIGIWMRDEELHFEDQNAIVAYINDDGSFGIQISPYTADNRKASRIIGPNIQLYYDRRYLISKEAWTNIAFEENILEGVDSWEDFKNKCKGMMNYPPRLSVKMKGYLRIPQMHVWERMSELGEDKDNQKETEATVVSRGVSDKSISYKREDSF